MSGPERSIRRRKKKAKDPLHVVFAASECLPFVKTGGLADVTASLPKELSLLGHTVEIFIPLYLKALLYPIENGTPIRSNTEFSEVRVRLGDYSFRSRIYSTEMPDAPVKVHLVDSETYEYFTSRSALSSPYSFGDNFGRFAFFSKVVATINAKRKDKPSVIHAHDWPTGLVPTFMSTEHASAHIPTLFTIHNMGYTQAVTPLEFYKATRLTDAEHPGLYDWKERGIQHLDKIDMLKAGIVRSDMVNTVSPTYAEEIQSSTFGGSYADTLRWLASKGQLKGILNGLDPLWRPSQPVDDFLAYKKTCKRQIQEIFELPQDDDAFLMVMTSRLAHQKGYQLLPEALSELRRRRVKMQLVAAVDGEPALRDMVAGLDSRELRVRHRSYNEQLTQTVVYPGADALLMPSVYEPCGLSQMIAQQNATIPIVHATGGLRDTVTDGVTGFVFQRFGPGELVGAVERAHRMYRDQPEAWDAMRRHVMDLDYSWAKSAEAYVDLYREAIRRSEARVNGRPVEAAPPAPVAKPRRRSPAQGRVPRTPRTRAESSSGAPPSGSDDVQPR